jgi:hypothetical protein
VLRQAWLLKRGEDLAKIWKKRYCVVINEPWGLVYFKRNPFEDGAILDKSKQLKARGYIDFNEVIEVKPHRSNQARFTLVTEARKWHFQTKNKDTNEWIAFLRKIVEGVQENKLVSVPLDDQQQVELQVVNV